MQHWLNWSRKEYMFQYLLSTIVLDFMGFPDNGCHHGWKLWMSKLSSELRMTVTCHMCSEQWEKIPVGMAGLKNPAGDLLGRGGKKSGGVKMQRVWECVDLRAYEENLHAETEERHRRRKQWEERTDPGEWHLSPHRLAACHQLIMHIKTALLFTRRISLMFQK